jgi:endonuclease/exonuclease/phosphatase family metal-dependent hydrolase
MGCLNLYLLADAQDTARVMTYNLMRYGATNSYCPIDCKQRSLKTIIDFVKPDIFAVNEITESAADIYADGILSSCFNTGGATNWKRAAVQNNRNPDIVNMLFYDSNKFGLAKQETIATNIRVTSVYHLYYKSADLATTGDTIFLRICQTHLKAGNTTSDINNRTTMTRQIMSYLAAKPTPVNTLVQGDFNVYTSSETAYQNMVAASDSNIRLYDPINRPGEWSTNSAFADIHTQAPQRTAPGPLYSAGGLDDRFDFILANQAIIRNSNKIGYISNSYKTLGQDGLRYNQSVTSPTNTVVPLEVARALFDFSDHLPVYMDLAIDARRITGRNHTALANELPVAIYLSGNPQSGERIQGWVASRINMPAGAHWSLIDMSGKMLFKAPLTLSTAADDYRFEIINGSIGSLSNGMYQLRLESADNELLGQIKLLIQQ